MDIHNKNIINKMFTDYNFLSSFCNKYNNDIEIIISEINYLIKFIFINKTSLKKYGLDDFYNYNRESITEEYFEYIEKNKKNKLFALPHNKKRKINKNLLDIIDDSIRIEDLDGINIPSRNRIKEICNNNERENKRKKESLKKRNEYYNKHRKFSESVLFYSRPDFLTIDKKFIYYHDKLSGDLNEDYEKIINDERYKNNEQNNPLKNNCFINLSNIKKHNDIVLRKYGDVYHIDNGRHRLLYLMINFNNITIPISNIRRRIEDKEFNIILKELIDNYKIYIFKNNILNDDANILIMYENKLYNLENKDMLRDFYYKLKNNDSIDIFFVGYSKIDPTCKRSEEIDKCSLMLYQKYQEIGPNLINNNFTDIIKYFNLSNNYYLRDAFETMQFNYKRAQIFKYNFDKYYEILLSLENFITNKDILFENKIDIQKKKNI